MRISFFIAKKLSGKEIAKQSVAQSITNIAVVGVALGMMIMILSVTIVNGFKTEIRNKIIGFGGHIIVTNFDANKSYETKPVNKNQPFYPYLDTVRKADYWSENLFGKEVRATTSGGISHIQTFAIKPGIIKGKSEIQGVVLKGIGTDFDWTFFEKNIVEGTRFEIKENQQSDSVLVSRYIANLLNLKCGDPLVMYFIQDPPRFRKFTIAGIYETGLLDFDKLYLFCDIGQIQHLNDWTKDEVTGFEILIDEFNDMDAMGVVVSEMIGFDYSPDAERFKVRTIKQENRALFDWLDLSDTNVWVLLVITIFVAGFNMVSGLLIIILERIHTIGVLKALGAGNKLIRQIFLYKGLFLIGKGMLWGNLIGMSLALIQKYLKVIPLDPDSYYIDAVPIYINLSHLLLLNAGALVVTFVMLLLPAMIVSKISPSIVVKYSSMA